MARPRISWRVARGASPKPAQPAFVQRLYPDLLDVSDPQRAEHGPVVIFIGDAKPDTAAGPVHAAWSAR